VSMTGSASRHGAYGLGLVEVKGPEVGHVLGPPTRLSMTLSGRR
jgi:hypothetical protein